MEESENNICTHCNTKDLTDLSNHNREVHIKSCKKKSKSQYNSKE